MPLPRVLEPEVMESVEEALSYDAMDHEEVNRAFVADLVAEHHVAGEVLDLGTGTARIPIEFCRQVEGVRIVAVDLAESMLDLARKNIEIAGYRDRIVLQRVDAKRLPYEAGRFNAVISNSIVHHLPRPLSALAEAVRVAAPGGALFFRDLCRPDSDARLAELVRMYAGGESYHAQQMFEASLHAALDLEEIRELVGQLGFDPATVTATSDRHWTWSARKAAAAGR